MKTIYIIKVRALCSPTGYRWQLWIDTDLSGSYDTREGAEHDKRFIERGWPIY